MVISSSFTNLARYLSQCPCQPQIPRTSTNHHTETSTRQHPHLLPRIPKTQILPPQREAHRSLRPNLQEDLTKAPQLLRWACRRRARKSDIQLRDFRASDSPVIGDCCRDCSQDIIEALWTSRCRRRASRRGTERRDSEARISKRGIAQPKTEFISRSNTILIETSIINEKALRIAIIAIYDCGPVIGRLFRDCVGQFAGGGGAAVEDVDEGVAGFLAGETGPYDGNDVGGGEDGLEEEGADGVDYDDGFFVGGGDGGDEGVAVVPGVEVDTVAGVAFDLWERVLVGLRREEARGGERRGTNGDVAFSGVGVDEY